MKVKRIKNVEEIKNLFKNGVTLYCESNISEIDDQERDNRDPVTGYDSNVIPENVLGNIPDYPLCDPKDIYETEESETEPGTECNGDGCQECGPVFEETEDGEVIVPESFLSLCNVD